MCRARTPPEKLLNFAVFSLRALKTPENCVFYPDISFCLLKNYNRRAKDKIMIKHKNMKFPFFLIDRKSLESGILTSGLTYPRKSLPRMFRVTAIGKDGRIDI
ncbi:hypothetical protein AVEN_176324-1 [Araneus ventricosus]|uniref:Uncharacterized protein n=1 Tax=Araneus ventricosus TaxID=182803 RepID=A0A4Y2R884_ARAVE|nr:hypothetical protein AVEN_176324-1 [Araneus ventricosus]